MSISTIILSWNRLELLKRTVDSYFKTRGNGAQLIVVDNGSANDTVEYLEEKSKLLGFNLIKCHENLGGEAFNKAIPFVTNDLVHLCENDQEFHIGWFEHVISAFESFDDLGQLSLFSDTPTDYEAWEPKPSHLRFSKGKILYQAHANLGTSSIIRNDFFVNNGLKIGNIIQGEFKFPDDGKLTNDIVALGYWAAWSDKYYVNNLGHEIKEFEENPDYYIKNYDSKPWVKVQGWKKRIEEAKSIPLPVRESISLPEKKPIVEKTIQPIGNKPSRIWSMFDGFTAETEVVDFLFSLVRLIKPNLVLETGTWLGFTGISMCRAMRMNGFGKLITLELDADVYKEASKNFKLFGVDELIDARLQSSLEYIPEQKIDFALFDSDLSIRAAEYLHFKPWLSENSIVAFHDTSEHHGLVKSGVKGLLESGEISGFNFPTPRGLFIGKPKFNGDI